MSKPTRWDAVDQLRDAVGEEEIGRRRDLIQTLTGTQALSLGSRWGVLGLG